MNKRTRLLMPSHPERWNPTRDEMIQIRPKRSKHRIRKRANKRCRGAYTFHSEVLVNNADLLGRLPVFALLEVALLHELAKLKVIFLLGGYSTDIPWLFIRLIVVVCVRV